MRKGDIIIKNQIGRKLRGGVIQSFLLDHELVSEINVIYLKFDSWLHISTDDETAVIEIDGNYPSQIESFESEDKSLFEYPLSKIENEYLEFKSYIGLTLKSYIELVDKDFENITCGLKFIFENGKSILTYTDRKEKTYIGFNDLLPNYLKEKNGIQPSV